MDDDAKSLKNELEDWLEAKITMKDVVHGKIAFHYTGTKGWTTWGSVISIKENTGLLSPASQLVTANTATEPADVVVMFAAAPARPNQ